MRLTLRTLLAWIDTVLGPEEQRQLGDKVAASEVAPRLVERIAAVVANPAISAPPPTGRGLADDPNTTAEFLDNVLDPARLEAFERVCIESDAHLADVAGCHGILAETIRDPTSVEPLEPARRQAALETARRRLRDSSSGDQVRIDTSAARPTARPVAPPRRRAPLTAWLSAAVAALLLVGLGGFLVWTLLRPRPAGPGQVAGPPVSVPAQDAKDRGPERQPVAAPDSRPPAPAAEVAAAPAAEAERGAEPPPIDPRPPAAAAVADAPSEAVQPPPPPPPAPEPPAPSAVAAATAAQAPTPALPPERSVPFGDALAIGGGTAAPAPPAANLAPADPAVAPPAAPPPEEGAPVLVEGVVLVRPAAEQEGWLAVAAAGPLSTPRGRLLLVAPAWSYPVVGLRGVTVRLYPGTTATLASDDRGLPRLELALGRAVAASGAGDLRLAVAAGGLEGIVAGPAGRPVGIEVAAVDGPSGDPPAAATLRAAVHAGGPATAWRQAAADGSGRPLMGIPPELLIPQGSVLRWDGRDPAGATLAPEPEPAWMRAATPADRTLKRAGADVAAALSSAPADPLDVLRKQVGSARPENRMVAAATLSFLGDQATVADLLCEDPPRGLHEGQWLALQEATVPRALARGGAEAESLLEALRGRAPAGCGDELVALARGLDPAVPPLARGSRLVDDLDSSSIAVRRFAILRLRELVPPAGRVGDDYRADRSALLRADSVARWRELVAQAFGGGEPPPPAAPPPRRDPE